MLPVKQGKRAFLQRGDTGAGRGKGGTAPGDGSMCPSPPGRLGEVWSLQLGLD